MIIDILVGTFLADTAAYFGGRMFGRRPLAPTISPHKTVEGLVCGMLIAILAVFVAGLYQDWLTQGDALLLGLAVAVLGPLGDLFESSSSATRAPRTRGRCSAPTGARWTASTRSSSRSWPATTCGSAPCTDRLLRPR